MAAVPTEMIAVYPTAMNESDDESSDDEEFLQATLQVIFPRRPKVYRPRSDYFLALRDFEFIERFRLSKDATKWILNKIRSDISSPTNRNHAVLPEQKLLLTLRYYATGSMLRTCADFTGIHISTASRIIRLVSHSLARLRPEFISMPQGENERQEVCQEFHTIARFPRCIGALDCTHIRIRSPGGNNAEIYRNRKGWFSLNVQAVSDAQLRIRNIVARWPGSAHDSTILRNSSLRRQFENDEFGEYVLVGDAGYAVSKYVLTPVSEPRNQAEDLYNESQIFTRNPIERCFGAWKRRFPVLSVGMNLSSLQTIMSIIVATAVLHNISNSASLSPGGQSRTK